MNNNNFYIFQEGLSSKAILDIKDEYGKMMEYLNTNQIISIDLFKVSKFTYIFKFYL